MPVLFIYSLSYITKGLRGMSKLLETASQESNCDNKDMSDILVINFLMQLK